MDNKTIFTKTAKGLGEAVGKTKALSRDFRNILKEIDGKASVEELARNLGNFSETKLQESLAKLANEDYIREFASPAVVVDDELDFTLGANPDDALTALTMGAFLRELSPQAGAARKHADKPGAVVQKAQVDEILRKEQATRAKEEADRKAKAEADARAKKEAEEQVRKKAAEEQARKAAEEKARREAEARAKKEAEEQVRKKAAEEQARKAAEEKARLEAEARAKKDAEEQARKKAAEEQARKAAEEKARLEAEARAKKDAEEQARKKAAEEEQARKAAEEKARHEAELQAQRAAEEMASVEAAEKAKEETEERARQEAEGQARQQAEEKARQEAELQARKETDAGARQEAEQQARQEADEKARRKAVVTQIRRDAIEKYKRDTEERARKEAQEKLRLEAEDLARMEAQEQARREAEEQSRREAEQRAQKEAETQARREAEEQLRRDAEEKSKRDAEERAKRDVEEQAQKEAEEEIRLNAERQARLEAEQKARREAEEEARLEAERVRHEAEERARKQAEQQAKKRAEREAKEKARLETEARARKEAEERAQRKAEDKARREAEKQAERDAKEKTQLEAEALARQEAAERAMQQEPETVSSDTRQQAEQKIEEPTPEQINEEAERLAAQEAKEQAEREAEQEAEQEAIREIARVASAAREEGRRYRTPIRWGRYVALLPLLLIAAGLVLVQVMSFDDQARLFEKTAAEQFQQPVKIGKAYLALIPQPHWRLEGVSVGKGAQIKVSQIDAMAELDTLFSDQIAFKSIALTSPVVNEEGLGWLLFGNSRWRDLKLSEVSASNAKLEAQNIGLPAFDARVDIGADGMWRKATLDAADRKAHIELQPKGARVQIELSADALAAVFGSSFPLEKINAKGTASRDELTMTEFNGILHDGVISGNGKLKWGASWSLGGELMARQINMANLAPQLLEGGRLEASASYAMQGQSANRLFSAPRLKGNANIRNGTLLGVDLASLLRSANSGGKSSFAELDSGFVYEGGRLQLRNVHLGAGLVSASGNADVDASGNLNGRFSVDLNAPSRKARADLSLSGTLKEPRFNR